MLLFLLYYDRPVAILIASAIALLIGTLVHELAHAYIAYRMGDPTGIDHGRTVLYFTNPFNQKKVRLNTVNPFRYVNPMGFLIFLITLFPMALGGAPINARRMRNPRWGLTAAVAAGPLSNLLVGVLFAIPWWANILPARPVFGSDLLPSITEIGIYIIYWNVLLFVFNLIPLYPLDGWTVVLGLLPSDLAYTWERYRQESNYVFILLIFLGFVSLQIPGVPNPIGLLIGEPTEALVRLFTGGW
jgi:Zn-dependent protease